MIRTDIQQMETLTQTYAEFDSRKGGLTTALGGILALLVGLHLFHPVRVLAGPWWKLQAAVVFLVPVLWLPLKQLLFHRLYRELGPVKANPDLAYEETRWRWLFMTALALMTFQTLALLGILRGFLGVLSHPETLHLLPARLPATWTAWLWVAAVPWLYLTLLPWWIKGVEEARAYLVLVGQGLVWIAFSFIQEGVSIERGSQAWAVRILLATQAGVIVWAIRTIRRGWKEHREYLAILRALPRES